MKPREVVNEMIMAGPAVPNLNLRYAPTGFTVLHAQTGLRAMGMSMLIVLCVVILGLGIYVAWTFNQLVQLRQWVNNGWSDIDVQLKRRSDLIPQIVRTVKGYATHEKTLFTEITKKRGQAIDAGDNLQARGAAERALSQPVSRLMAVAEDYPELKANSNFLDLQNELSETENKIEMARRFYNGAVRGLNIKVQTFPANIVAGIFRFSQREYFDISPTDAAAPSVDFSS